MDVLVSLCKRRGFVFQSSEIYGGTGSCWDYGPLGVELKNNIKRVWWRDFVQQRADMVGLDASILMHPHGVEGERPRRQLHRPDGRLPRVQAALPRRPDRRDAVDALLRGDQGQQVHDPAGEAVQALRRAAHAVPGVRQGRADRAAPVQPHVQDVHGPGRGGRRRHLPAAGDGAGHLRQLRQRAAVDAAQAAVRHRPDRQGVPQRDHARQLHLPDARVRADGDRVLREPARDASTAGPPTRTGTTGGSRTAWRGSRATACSRRTCGCTSTSRTSWPTTPSARSTSSTSSRSAGASSMGIANRTDFDLKQHAKFSGKSLTYFDEERKEHVVPFVIEPSAGVDRALLAFLRRRLPRGGGPGREARRAALPPRAGAGQGRGAAAAQEARRDRAPPATTLRDRLARRWVDASTTTPRRSAASTAGRTRWARPTA